VQISEADTPPHRYQTIYRRLVEQLSTSSVRTGAFRSVVDAWFFTLEEDVLSGGIVNESDTAERTRRTASSWNVGSATSLGRRRRSPRFRGHI
jgi:hypothetical protein